MSQDVSLEALIGRLRAGDEEAVHDLINEYGEPIRRMANVHIRRFRIEKTCDAEDIQTKVLTRIWKEFQHEDSRWTPTSREDFCHHLLEMTQTAVEDWIERMNRRDEQASRGKDYAELLSLLTPEAQRLFRLRFLDGREWSEIAEMEGTTVDDCRKSFERQVRPLAEGLALQIEQPIDDCVR